MAKSFHDSMEKALLKKKKKSKDTNYGLEKGPIENHIFITSGNQGTWKRSPTLTSGYFRPCLKAFSQKKTKIFYSLLERCHSGGIVMFSKT